MVFAGVWAEFGERAVVLTLQEGAGPVLIEENRCGDEDHKDEGDGEHRLGLRNVRCGYSESNMRTIERMSAPVKAFPNRIPI
jgi:hypothetical protein